MAKTIASYKGIWKKPAASSEPEVPVCKTSEIPGQRTQVVAPASFETRHIQAAFAMAASQASASQASASQASASKTSVVSQTPPSSPDGELSLPPNLLAHRYRMLVLKDHRHKLGRDLLDLGHRDPWQLAWASLTSLGRSFRPWAHARIFALGCYLGMDMSPEILRQLRHPLWFRRYRRSMLGLWRLLEILAQRTGQKPLSRLMFQLFYAFPPLAVLIYEKQLQALLRKVQGTSPAAAPVLARSAQGQ